MPSEVETWCSSHGDSDVWAEAKPWLEVNEAMAVNPEMGKELSDILVNFQDKIRTFKESRQLVAARNVARGFYPLASKGKGKNKGKSVQRKGTEYDTLAHAVTGRRTTTSGHAHVEDPEVKGQLTWCWTTPPPLW